MKSKPHPSSLGPGWCWMHLSHDMFAQGLWGRCWDACWVPGCSQSTWMPRGCRETYRVLGCLPDTGDACRVPGCPLGVGNVSWVLRCPQATGMPTRCQDAHWGYPQGARVSTGFWRCLSGAGIPARYRGCPKGAERPQNTRDARGVLEMPGAARCPGGTGDARGVRGMPWGCRVPAGCQDARRGGGGGGVPGLRRGSGATWWAAASRSRAGSGRASPGPAGGRENGTGLLERRSSSFARQPQRLQTGSARRSGQLLARRQESSGLPSALPCSSSLADPADILLLLLLPRGTRVPVPPPASCSEELVPSEKAVRVELAARFPGNGCRPSRRDRLGVYHHRAGSLAGIAVSRAHQGTEILASDAAYGNLSSRLRERSKSPKAGGARGKPLPCERSP